MLDIIYCGMRLSDDCDNGADWMIWFASDRPEMLVMPTMRVGPPCATVSSLACGLDSNVHPDSQRSTLT